MAESTFEEGRYLYCVVNVENGVSGGSVTDFSETGIDGDPVSVLVHDGFGAVVQSCDSPFDSDDLGTVQEWLLTHQSVVDAAGETFGTPLPFRFDTILKGDDDAVVEWLSDQSETLETHLDDFAGHWEYRVGVAWDEARVRDELESDDEQLAELRGKVEEASEGTAFLLEKQYDNRLRDLRRARQKDLTARLREGLDPLVREFDVLDSSRGVLDSDSSDEVVQVAFLAHEDREEDIGELLDDVAADPGIEIRFTGPWPPYSFAPELDA